MVSDIPLHAAKDSKENPSLNFMMNHIIIVTFCLLLESISGTNVYT